MARLNINRVTLAGHVGADPKTNYTKNGTRQLSFSVATNRSYERNGKWVDETTWHSVQVWGRKAEQVADLIVKGAHVYIEGRFRSWTYNDERYYAVDADVVSRLDVRRTREEAYANADSEPAPIDEDIPF